MSSSSSLTREMMKKAVTTADSFYSGGGGVEGYKDRKDNIRATRREQKNTLSQWYGMKKTTLNDEQKQELELLQYRNFVNPNLKHQAPKLTSGTSSDFVEFGFVVGTGRNKRRRYKSFADEWIEENPQFAEVVQRRMKQNVKFNKKAKANAAKKEKADRERAKAKTTSKRKWKKDFF